jgi:hypothetical protein
MLVRLERLDLKVILVQQEQQGRKVKLVQLELKVRLAQRDQLALLVQLDQRVLRVQLAQQAQQELQEQASQFLASIQIIHRLLPHTQLALRETRIFWKTVIYMFGTQLIQSGQM